MKRVSRIAVMIAGAVAAAPAPAVAAGPEWVATWGTAMAKFDPTDPLQLVIRSTFPDMRAHDQTLREVVRASIGGERVRVRISNVFGEGPLRLGRVTVAAGGAPVDALFDGKRARDVPAGAEVYTDPVALRVAGNQELVIGMHVVESPPTMSLHFAALTDSTATPPGTGDRTADQGSPLFVSRHRFWPWVTGVEVSGHRETGAVVALGDSFTDGAEPTNLFTESKDSSWPSLLAARLQALPGDRYARGVVNAGIAGNGVASAADSRLGEPGVKRLERDVLSRAGVTHLILGLGGNDLMRGGSVEGVIAGLTDVARRARARGIRVIGTTLPPDDGESWARLNAWIRSTAEYDAVFDINRILADPADPTAMRREYVANDQAHANAAGRRAMAEGFPVEALACAPVPEIGLTKRGVRRSRRGRLTIRGTASAGRCPGAVVDRVTVALARQSKGRCRFVGVRGRLGPATGCANALAHVATGTAAWRYAPARALPAGLYRVTASARAGTAESAPVTLFVRVRS